MDFKYLDTAYLLELSKLQYYLYRDKYYTLEEYRQIRKLIKKLLVLLERSNYDN